MCMRYENQYNGECFDYLAMTFLEEASFTTLLKKWYDVKINDNKEFKNRLLTLLEKMHEDKIIEPQEIIKGQEGKTLF